MKNHRVPGTRLSTTLLLLGTVILFARTVRSQSVEIYGAFATDQLGSVLEAQGDLNRDGVADLSASADAGKNPFLPAGDSSGYAISLPGGQSALSAQAVLASPHGGSGLSGFGGHLSPTLRTWIAYSGGSASVTTATLTRSAAASNLPSDALAVPALWRLSTDRTGWTSASLSFRYTDSELPAGASESGLRLFRAPSAAGPWTPVPTTIEPVRNLARAEVDSLSYFTITQSDCAVAFTDLDTMASSYVYGSPYAGTFVSGSGFTDPNLTLSLRASGQPDRSVWYEFVAGNETLATLRFRVDRQPNGAPVAPPLGTFNLVASNGSCEVAWPSAVTVTSPGGSSCSTVVSVACGASYSSATGPLLPSGSTESWFSVPVPAGESLNVGLASSGGAAVSQAAIYESCSDVAPLAQAAGTGDLNLGFTNPTASPRPVLVKISAGSADYETSFSCTLLPTGSGASCLTPYQVLETATFSPVPAGFSSTSLDRSPCLTGPNTVSYWIELPVPARQAVEVRAWNSNFSPVGVSYFDSCGEDPLDSDCAASDVTGRFENEWTVTRTVLALVSFDAADPDRNFSVTYSGLPPAGSSCVYPRDTLHGDAFGEANPAASDSTTFSVCLNTSATPRWLRINVPPQTTATVAAASGVGNQAEPLSVTFTQANCGGNVPGSSACGAGLVSASWWNEASTTATILARIDSDAETSHPEIIVWMEETVPAGWTCLAPVNAGCGTSVDTLTSMPASGVRTLPAFTGATSAPVGARWITLDIPPLIRVTVDVTGHDPGSSVAVALLTGCTGAVLSEQVGTQTASASSANFGATTSTVLALINSDRSTTPPVLAVTCRPADQTPPVVLIDSPTSAAWYNSIPVLLDWSVSEPITATSATLTRTAFGGTVTAAPVSDGYGVTSEGRFILQVQVTDLAGNDSETTSVEFGIDLTSPSLSLSPADAWTSLSAVILSGEAADTTSVQSGLKELRVRVDSTPWRTIRTWDGATSAAFSHEVTGLSEGLHTIRFEVLDQAGNVSVTREHQVTVDQTPPAVVVSGPAPIQTSTDPVSFTAGYSGASSVTLSSEHVTVNATGTATAALVAVTGTGVETRTVTLSGISGDGTLSISILPGTAHDLAGNSAPGADSPTSATVDNTGPVMKIVFPTSFTWSNAASVTLDWDSAALDLVTSTGLLTWSGFDRALSVRNVSDGEQVTSEGRYLLEVSGTDWLDNTGSTTSTDFGIDRTSPTLVLHSGDTLTSLTSITLQGEASDTSSAQSGLRRVEARVDSGSWFSVANYDGVTTATFSFTATGLQEGTRTITLRAVDVAENASLLASHTVTVDLTAPTITIDGPSPSLTKDGPVIYTVNFAGASEVTLSAGDILPEPTGTATGTVSVSGEGVSTRTVTVTAVSGDGLWKFRIRPGTAQDQAGNLAAQAESQPFEANNTAPVMTIDWPTSFTWTNQVPVILDWNTTATDLLTSEGLLTHTAFDGVETSRTVVDGDGITSQGRFLLQVSGIDRAGNESLTTWSSFGIDRTTPSLAFQGPSECLATTSPVLVGLALENSGLESGIGLVEGQIDGGPWQSIGAYNGQTSVTFEYRPGPLAEAAHTIALRTRDPAGNVAEISQVITVDVTAPSITLSEPSPLVTNRGPLNYTLTFAGADWIQLTPNDIVVNKTGTANLSNIAVTGAGLTTRTVTLSGLSGDGTLSISLPPHRASDCAGNASPDVGPSLPCTVDNTSPTLSITGPHMSPNCGGLTYYLIQHSGAIPEEVVGPEDIVLYQTGSATGLVQEPDCDKGSECEVAIDGITGEGTLRISLREGAALDQAGNRSAAVGPSNPVVVTCPVNDDYPNATAVTCGYSASGDFTTYATLSDNSSDIVTSCSAYGIDLMLAKDVWFRLDIPPGPDPSVRIRFIDDMYYGLPEGSGNHVGFVALYTLGGEPVLRDYRCGRVGGVFDLTIPGGGGDVYWLRIGSSSPSPNKHLSISCQNKF